VPCQRLKPTRETIPLLRPIRGKPRHPNRDDQQHPAGIGNVRDTAQGAGTIMEKR